MIVVAEVFCEPPFLPTGPMLVLSTLLKPHSRCSRIGLYPPQFLAHIVARIRLIIYNSCHKIDRAFAQERQLLMALLLDSLTLGEAIHQSSPKV